MNRFFCPYTNEAARALDEGLGTTGEIDAVACDVLQAAAGPFAVMNLIKPRINLHAIRNLAPLGPFYAPAAAMVTVSVAALVVIVILAPAARVNVSGAASATRFDCPATAMLPNAIVDPPPPVPAMSLMSFGEKLRSAVTVPGTVFSAGSTWRGNRRAAVV